jgi:putative phosphoesterase
LLIGVISDTHGLLRPEASHTLEGCQLILHVGDVGDPGILDALEMIAPVTAVRGNVDRETWAVRLPTTQVVEVEGETLYMLHNLEELELDPGAAGFRAVIFGHSHRPLIEQRGGVLFLNPGSAGPRRFKLPISMARIHITGGEVRAELVQLKG